MQDFDDPGDFQVAFCLECSALSLLSGLYIRHSPCAQIHMYCFSEWIKIYLCSRGVVGKLRRGKQWRDLRPRSVFNQDSGAEICLWADVLLRVGPHTNRAQGLRGCPISAEKCSSTSAGRRAPEEACHQSSLLLQAGSSASPYQPEGRRRGENHGGQQIPLTNNQIGELIHLFTVCPAL